MSRLRPSIAVFSVLLLCCSALVLAQDTKAPEPGAQVDINAIKPGETYRWGNGNYLENKGGCRFDIGGKSWGPRNFRAPTGKGVHRVNNRQTYTADCINGNIKLVLTDDPQ